MTPERYCMGSCVSPNIDNRGDGIRKTLKFAKIIYSIHVPAYWRSRARVCLSAARLTLALKRGGWSEDVAVRRPSSVNGLGIKIH